MKFFSVSVNEIFSQFDPGQKIKYFAASPPPLPLPPLIPWGGEMGLVLSSKAAIVILGFCNRLREREREREEMTDCK